MFTIQELTLLHWKENTVDSWYDRNSVPIPFSFRKSGNKPMDKAGY